MRLSGDIGDVYTSTLIRTREQYIRLKEAFKEVDSSRSLAMRRDIDDALRKIDAELKQRGAGNEQAEGLCRA